MRKMMGCLLTALMLLGMTAAAAESTCEPLTLQELDAWADGLCEAAQGEEGTVYEDEGETAYDYSFGTLYYEDDTLTAVVLTDMESEDLRGIRVGMPVSYVLTAYGSENEELAGSHEAAVAYLYLSDDAPLTGSAGLVSRDGQRIQTIQYMAFEKTDAGCRAEGVLYTVEEGLVSAIRVYGLNTELAETELDAQIEALLQVHACADYAQVRTSRNGDDLTMFGPEDLCFGGCEWIQLTPETAENAWGRSLEDIWLEDEDGYIRMVQFADCGLTLLYDAEKKNGRLISIEALTDTFEGPRAVRLGDSLTDVLYRFRHGDGEFSGLSEMLYGTEGQAPYGMAQYAADGSATVRYAAPLTDGRTVVLMISFEQLTAREIMIYMDE